MIQTILLSFLSFSLAIATTGYVVGQAPAVNVVSTTAAGNEKIATLSPWIGHWKGESLSRMGPGEMKRSTVDERIESKLEGAILLIEGVGKATDSKTNQETIVHHALAILSYDQTDQKYKFRSYLDNGRSTDAWFNAISSTQYQWGFDTPRGKMRYNITIDPEKKTWTETGEFSADGKTWNKFIDMTLNRVD